LTCIIERKSEYSWAIQQGEKKKFQQKREFLNQENHEIYAKKNYWVIIKENLEEKVICKFKIHSFGWKAFLLQLISALICDNFVELFWEVKILT